LNSLHLIGTFEIEPIQRPVMQKLVYLTCFSLSTLVGFSQTVPSSCSAPDSVVNSYEDDAVRITLEYGYQNNLSFRNDIEVPQPQVDTILNALIAVYNATGLAARDTVVDIYTIHDFGRASLYQFGLGADSSLAWMKQLESNTIPCGESTVDSLINSLSLTVTDYFTYPGLISTEQVEFTSPNPLNMRALVSFVDSIPDVAYGNEYSYAGDGNRISGSIHQDHVELIYSIGWGDCPAGCINRRFWKFKVYHADCSVEFVESYGDDLSSLSNGNSPKNTAIKIYPNPFNNFIVVQHLTGDGTYSISSVTGQLIMNGNLSESNTNIELAALPKGIYVLTVTNKGATFSQKVLKN